MKLFTSNNVIKAGFISLTFLFTICSLSTVAQQINRIVGAKKTAPTVVELSLADNQRMIVDFYGENIFRLFQDNHGGAMRDPEAKPSAQVLVKNPRKPVTALTHGTATQYQYLFGPSFLIAPVYQATKADEGEGNDIRNNIYLPEGKWIDYFSGDVYNGNSVINNFDVPIWKLPVFVKSGAIIPMANPNNNVAEINKALRTYEIYPAQSSSFTDYDDDGLTEAYKLNKGVSTLITTTVDKDKASVTIETSKGSFDGFVKDKATSFIINVTEQPKSVTAVIGGKKVSLKPARTADEFEQMPSAYYYDATPNLNKFATKGSDFEKVVITKNPQIQVKLPATDVTQNKIELHVKGFYFEPVDKIRMSSGALNVPDLAQVTAKNRQAFSLKPTWQKVSHADFYEIAFHEMLYTTIRDTTFLFDDLTPETAYLFKIRAANKDGYSDWATINAKTASNPLQFAIKGIKATSTAEDQSGSGINNMFDFDANNGWHTKWDKKSVPFDIVLDLKSSNQIEKIHYLPRSGGGNGVLLKGTIFYSTNKTTWTEAGKFDWAKNGDVKIFELKDYPTASYIKIAVTEATGNFGSGREIYVFRVPGTDAYLPGDINNDKLIDGNDLTSYTNYTGLRLGDADFDGYISKGDVNKNNLIDAYDISNVAVKLNGGVVVDKADPLTGKITIKAAKTAYKAGEIVELKVKGTNLTSVNAMSFALPYPQEDFEFVSLQPIALKGMDNLSYDRLHSNGKKALYPTFVNVGDKETIKGDADLLIIRFKAKRNVTFDFKAINGLLVDKALNSLDFIKGSVN